MNREELDNKLELHALWLNNEPGGVQLDLSCRNLSGMSLNGYNFYGAILHQTNFSGAQLNNADLSCTDAIEANFAHASLIDADLRMASLAEASLKGVDAVKTEFLHAFLEDTNLTEANLRNANLYSANMVNANLQAAHLEYANLEGADVRGANFSSAILNKTNLKDIIYDCNTANFESQCPQTGSFIGYKICHGKLVTLLITAGALRSSATSRKCRCSEALVLKIEDDLKEITSDFDPAFIYKVGATVKVSNFDEDRWHECSTGIHFFLTEEGARIYAGL